ncbi:hypothetical protein [Nonomuraea guangzhouensis]|uniref:Uncharacterized protein n=1 Tax=Nonomuraea guangzhouensis TaxID=1291555 RepID=A0ABW4GX95_9ACTN|nr:hypothetical protein [Nonomuraea guangzhouensis]
MTATKSTELRSFTSDVLVRIAGGQLFVMNKPEQGWETSSQCWTWNEVVHLDGWELGGCYRDEHGDGFWLHAVGGPVNGIYGTSKEA